MDSLRTQIQEAESVEMSLVILKETETDVLTDDFDRDKHINYHLIPPTVEWLEERFYWAPSITGDTRAWTSYLANLLMRMDANMLICLNRIVFMQDEESDCEAVCTEMDSELCEFPYMGDDRLGIYWSSENSVIINLMAIKRCVEELMSEGFEYYSTEDVEMRRGVLITLFHELRHLGLDNPFLPMDAYPVSEGTERAVEEWARDAYEQLFKE